MRPRLLLPWIILLLLAACGGRSSLERVDTGRGTYRAPSQPSPLPAGVIDKARFRELDGKDTSLASIVGQGRVVVVNLWATWCKPCRMEIPMLTAMSRDLSGKAVEIIGLSVEDPGDSTDRVKMFATQYGIQYRLGFASDETFDALSGTNQAGVVPQTLVFDKTGKLTLHLRGLHPDFAAVVRRSIEDAL